MADPDPYAAVARFASDLEADGFSGVLRVTRGDDVLLESCHGMANRAEGTPVRSSTRFATASLSKMFTAVGILDAAGRGEVGVDEPVADVLPAHLRPSTLRADVMVHHLLSHSSGIADYFEEDENLPDHQEDYGALWREIPCYGIRDYASLLPLFADLPPNFPPGEGYHYSNAGFVLLGLILQEVSGLPFADAVTARVFEPAGMTASGYPAMDEVHPDVATGYLPPLTAGGPWRTNIYSVPAVGGGDGGAVVSAPDVERFLRAIVGGDVWRGVSSADVLTPRVKGEGRWWAAYGVNVRDDGVFGKSGGDPGVVAFSRYRPETDTTAVLLANVDWEDVDGIDDLVQLLQDAALDN